MKNKKLITLLLKASTQGNVFALDKNLTQNQESINQEILNQITTYAILNNQVKVIEYITNHYCSNYEYLNIFNTQVSRTPLMLALSQYHEHQKIRTVEQQQIIDLLIAHSDFEVGQQKEVNIKFHYKKAQDFPIDTIRQDAFTTAITHLDFNSALKILKKGYNTNKYYSYAYYGEDSYGNASTYILDFVSRARLKYNISENFSSLKEIIIQSISEENIFFNDNNGIPPIFSIAYFHKFSIEQKEELLLNIFKNNPILLNTRFSLDELDYYSNLASKNLSVELDSYELTQCKNLASNIYSLIEKQLLENNIEQNDKLSLKPKIKI
jgi:hypothetical protein